MDEDQSLYSHPRGRALGSSLSIGHHFQKKELEIPERQRKYTGEEMSLGIMCKNVKEKGD